MTQALFSRLEPGARIASMGYPDFVAPLELLEEFFDLREIDYRQDSEAICKRHGMPFHGIPDAHSVFSHLKCELDVYDITDERGCEIYCDLNNPFDGGSYDFVLDVGTLEHCFNVAQAAENMVRLMSMGGIIIHENPFQMGNHGFYSLNPTWYADFYGQEGFKLLDLKLVLRDGRVGEVPHTGRFKYSEQVEANVFAVAERTDIKPIEWVVQSKYRALLTKEKHGN